MKAILKSQKFRFLMKLLLVGGLLYFLGQKGFLSIEATQKALGKWEYILPAFLAMFTSSLIAVVRWHALLKTQTIYLHPLRTFQLAFIGNFFNIALPGAVSGDVVKAIYVSKEIDGKRAWALSSILFDRVVGVSALIMVSGGALLATLGEKWSNKLMTPIQLFVTVATLGTFAFYAYLLMIKEEKDPLMKLFKTLEKRIKFMGSFKRIYEGVRRYHAHRKTVFFVLFLSILIHLLVTFACLNFAWAMGLHDIPILAIFVLVPIGLLFTAIPVMPAGVGTGHAAFLALFHLLGSQRGADVFNLLLLFNFTLGAIGGLIYLRFKSSEPISVDFNEKSEIASTS